MAKQSLEDKVKKLEETINSYKLEMERMQAVNEIHNLMSKYEYLHMTNRQKEVIELYAKNTPDVRVSIQEHGYWEGPDAPSRAWGILDIITEEDRVGMMAIHPITTPVIEVAKDGETAKGVWIGTGFTAGVDKETGKPHAGWEWDRYGVDFIKEDGKWKFWHFHVYLLFRCGWDDKWADQFAQKRGRMVHPDEFKPDGPAVDHYPYKPDTVVPLIPVPPEPYETFDQTFRY